MLNKITIPIARYRRYILPVVFILGFAFDYLTLTKIDRLYDNLVLLSYIAVSALGIVIVYSPIPYKWGEYLRAFTPAAVQFAFGGLFSGFLVFYSRSASLAASWPFILLLVSLFIGNEIFKKKYAQLTFQLSVFYFLLFSYFIFLVPVLLGRMGSWVFLLSGIVSLLTIFLFIRWLELIDKQKISQSKKYLKLSIGGVFLAINILYFTNIIPPIPLSLKEIAVYYSVERIGPDNYQLQSIPQPWYNFLRVYEPVSVLAGRPLFVFSSVFAPTALKTNIVHHWQYYDSIQNKWVSSLKVAFPVVGGRDGGYRGFSEKELVFPGYWRVNVETSNGLLIGRKKFLIIN